MPGPGRARKDIRLKTRPILLGTSSVVLLVAIWQLVADARIVNSLFLPRPMQVASALGTLFSGGSVWSNLAVSGEEFAAGLGISIALGAVLGILTVRRRRGLGQRPEGDGPRARTAPW